jgi:hypothetical protein
MTVREFWREVGFLPRVAVAVAALSLALNAGTYLGLRARGPLAGLYAVHLLVMLLLAALFVLYARAAVSRRGMSAGEAPKVHLPRVLPWGAVATAVYLGALFAYAFARYGEGGPEVVGGREVWVRPGGAVRALPPGELRAFERLELRLFSAGWLFFALVVAQAGHRVLARLRTLSAHRRAAT